MAAIYYDARRIDNPDNFESASILAAAQVNAEKGGFSTLSDELLNHATALRDFLAEVAHG